MSVNHERAREERERIYREHNVTRREGFRTTVIDEAERRGAFGVMQQRPNPHEGRCQCDDCRRVTRESGRTVANEQGER